MLLDFGIILQTKSTRFKIKRYYNVNNNSKTRIGLFKGMNRDEMEGMKNEGMKNEE
jgi:hypothetical protein